ncbi:MAG: phage late control D family protein [Azoarcus sp.]|nr:phage late control D family protein [Azoarcus sp.]
MCGTTSRARRFSCRLRIEVILHLYPLRPHCLQYRENDLAFIERLLFEEGIAYFFEHDTERCRSAGCSPSTPPGIYRRRARARCASTGQMPPKRKTA